MEKVFIPKAFGEYVMLNAPKDVLLIGIPPEISVEVNGLWSLNEMGEDIQKQAKEDILQKALRYHNELPNPLRISPFPTPLPPNIFVVFLTPQDICNTHQVARLCGSEPLVIHETWTQEGEVLIIIKGRDKSLRPNRRSYIC
jgi:hypothetical protein